MVKFSYWPRRGPATQETAMTDATPHTDLLVGDIITLPSGKYPTDEWRVTEVSGPWLQLQRLYPRPGIVNQIDTCSPVLPAH